MLGRVNRPSERGGKNIETDVTCISCWNYIPELRTDCVLLIQMIIYALKFPTTLDGLAVWVAQWFKYLAMESEVGGSILHCTYCA